ncbi:MAG: o-succinylbenzoate synthase [Xenococcaceae cyanobacterium]
MDYRFQFRPYQRHFRQPLKTSHGSWEVREGIILRLTDDVGKVGWGEIAPLPWFGSETLEEALAFCRQLGEEVTGEEIEGIPEELSACQFGFESAVEDLSRAKALRRKEGDKGARRRCFYSCLLPAGEAALQEWQTVWEKGNRGDKWAGKGDKERISQLPVTFKWKIGVRSIEEEIKVFGQLAQALPARAKLRLDANGGLCLEEAKEWLRVADKAGIVEFVEQPLCPQQFDLMLELSANYSTPLALDESVANLKQLEDCYRKGWRGIFVIKAAIAGSPKRLRQFCQEHEIDAVFSSVFETAIGSEAALRLAAELSPTNRAVGFGVNHWFREDEENWLENLWNNY